MTPTGPWLLRLEVRSYPPQDLEWLARALSPELAREVPRASPRIDRPGQGRLLLEVSARDTGAARAAANTYLGWIHLAEETTRRARAATGDVR